MCYLKKKLTKIFVEQKFEDYPLKNIFLNKSLKIILKSLQKIVVEQKFGSQKFEDVESWKRVSTQQRRVKKSWQHSHRFEDFDQPTK